MQVAPGTDASKVEPALAQALAAAADTDPITMPSAELEAEREDLRAARAGFQRRQAAAARESRSPGKYTRIYFVEKSTA